MYFSFFKLKKWGKMTAAARRHNCAVLPYFFFFLFLMKSTQPTAKAATAITAPIVQGEKLREMKMAVGPSAPPMIPTLMLFSLKTEFD